MESWNHGITESRNHEIRIHDIYMVDVALPLYYNSSYMVELVMTRQVTYSAADTSHLNFYNTKTNTLIKLN